MILTEPKVRLIAVPSIRWSEVLDYLVTIGGEAWFHRVFREEASEAELLVEIAGRLCYKSWAVGLNPNVTMVREDSEQYAANILSSKHGAVLEHSQCTFIFSDVSRVFTHELVRHRAGVAISQESLRYVRLTDIGFRIPEILDPLEAQIISVVETLEEFQKTAAEQFGLDDEGVPFHYKKEVTSALRRLAPLGLSTNMVWSANLRTLRHLLQLRTAASAEEEIRYVFNDVGQICKAEFPFLFNDFEAHEIKGSDIPAWVPKWEKV